MSDTQSEIVVWSQWPDLDVPSGVRSLSPADGSPSDLADDICFYVPEYMTGPAALETTRQMPRLDVIQLPTAGYDSALAFCRPGVTLCNAAGVHNESTAELAVTLTLASLRGIPRFVNQSNHRTWRRERYGSLTDSRVAVVGHGAVGSTVMRMLAGFAVDATAFSRTPRPDVVAMTELVDRIGEFDVVILTLPLTDETRGMFGADLLRRMHDGALLVNVARGPVVDTDALVAELRAERLHAALDVTDPEPLESGHPLWDFPHCLITPHVGGDTTAFEPRMRRLIRSQLERLVTNTPLTGVIEGAPSPRRPSSAGTR